MALSAVERRRLAFLRGKKSLSRMERAELAELRGRESAATPRKRNAPSPTTTGPTAGTVRMVDRQAAETPATPAKPAAPTRTASAAPAAGSAPRGRAAVSSPPSPAAGLPDADVERIARDQYGYMAWALDDPELGPILRKAATEGWDPNKLKGAVFGTNWFRVHGTANVVRSLKQVSDSYLVPMSDDGLRSWALKVVTGQVQTAEFADTMKEQAKGLWGDFGGALDRGFTVAQITDSYRQRIARELEIAPETIDLNQPKWQSLVVRRDPASNKLYNPSLSDAVTAVRTDDTYGWDRTSGAREQAAGLEAQLLKRMGALA